MSGATCSERSRLVLYRSKWVRNEIDNSKWQSKLAPPVVRCGHGGFVRTRGRPRGGPGGCNACRQRKPSIPLTVNARVSPRNSSGASGISDSGLVVGGSATSAGRHRSSGPLATAKPSNSRLGRACWKRPGRCQCRQQGRIDRRFVWRALESTAGFLAGPQNTGYDRHRDTRWAKRHCR